MEYRFLTEDEMQAARYAVAKQLEEQHYRNELQLRQLRRVAPEAPEIEQFTQQQESIEAQLDAVLEDDDPR